MTYIWEGKFWFLWLVLGEKNEQMEGGQKVRSKL
jgi:hypothetical protein